MVKAYILIEMAAGHSRGLVDAVASRPGFAAIDRVTGPYDVVAVLEAGDINEISDIIAKEVHTKPGVLRTTTCVSLEH